LVWERQAEIVASGLLVHGVEQIAGPAFGHGLCGPERRVQFGGERVGGIGCRAESEQREVLQGRGRGANPPLAIVD